MDWTPSRPSPRLDYSRLLELVFLLEVEWRSNSVLTRFPTSTCAIRGGAELSISIEELAQCVRLVACDVDGTLTDGGMTYAPDGGVSKRFHVRDGIGVRLLQAVGVEVAWVTSDESSAVVQRAERLNVYRCLTGVVDKLTTVADLCTEIGITMEETAFLGDDLQDLEVMQAVGLPVAVADAVDPLLDVAKYICSRNGGSGAFRELTEMLLTSRGLTITDAWNRSRSQ